METAQKRRGHGEDSIYFDSLNNRWTGAVSLGHSPDGKRIRRKVTGRTKTEVKGKLRELREDISDGVKTSASYTVKSAIDDWLKEGLNGKSDTTVELYETLSKPVADSIGAMPLRDLTAHAVRAFLVKLAESSSTRTVQITHNILVRAIRHAEANDHVRRNVAALVEPPKGKEGRPSKAMDPEQAAALLKAAEDSRLYAYIVLCLMTGIRTEEARALRWDHVDLDAGTVSVWRSVRASGDTKTQKSRRTLGLPQLAIDALRAHKVSQATARLEAGPGLWQDHGLVFTSAVGTPLDRHNVLREFRKITKAAGLGGDWVPRELRHSFVSMMSASGVAVEEIARLAGHSNSRTTESVYRKELRPALTRGAEVMDALFTGK
jgi:integrase